MIVERTGNIVGLLRVLNISDSAHQHLKGVVDALLLVGWDLAGQSREERSSGCQEAVGLPTFRPAQSKPHHSPITPIALPVDPASLDELGHETADGALLQAKPGRQLRLRQAIRFRQLGQGMCHRDADRLPTWGLVWLKQTEGSDERHHLLLELLTCRHLPPRSDSCTVQLSDPQGVGWRSPSISQLGQAS